MEKIRECVVCHRYTSTTHHLLFGNANRPLCDRDNICIPLCDDCHTMSGSSLHHNSVASRLSKIAGQAIWERQRVAEGKTEEEAREDFIKRYGQSFITVEGL